MFFPAGKDKDCAQPLGVQRVLVVGKAFGIAAMGFDTFLRPGNSVLINIADRNDVQVRVIQQHLADEIIAAVSQTDHTCIYHNKHLHFLSS